MILVTGSKGMLGSWLCSMHPKDTIGCSRADLDITNYHQAHAVLNSIKPDVVINAAGVNKAVHNTDYFSTNAEGPRILATICSEMSIRLIQMSTDCVFKGDRGGYGETDTPDTEEAYGVSKLMGEVIYRPHLTVRTSFVGWPDPAGRGLLAWMKSQSAGSYMPGYDQAIWNGLTVWGLCKYLLELAYSPIHGVIHLHGQTLSKYHLLQTANEVFDWNYNIYPVQEPVLNRTLRTVRSDVPYISGAYNFHESCREMQKWEHKIGSNYVS